MRETVRSVVAVAAAIGVCVAVLPATANATPSRGVTAVTILDRVVGNTEYVLKQLTIAPGGGTGWHYHSGLVHALVVRGVLTHNMSDCSIDGVYHPGQVINETPGDGYVHMGRNLGSTPVVLEALYEAPVGQPLVVDAPNPGCPFQ